MLVQRRQRRIQHKSLLLRARPKTRQASFSHRCDSFSLLRFEQTPLVAYSSHALLPRLPHASTIAESSHAILSCYVKFTGVSGRDSMYVPHFPASLLLTGTRYAFADAIWLTCGHSASKKKLR